MAWYLLSIEKRGSALDAEKFYTALERCTDWVKPLLSSWFLQTTYDPDMLIFVLRGWGVIEQGDGFTILEITGRGRFEGIEDEELDYFLNHRIIRI